MVKYVRLNGMRCMKLNANREDVAREAGVSVSTVSYVLNNSREFSEDTKKRVFDAVEKLNYKPHIIARGLSPEKTHQIAITVDNVDNPYYSQIMTGFQDAALQMGYFVNVCIGEHNMDRYLNSFSSRQLDGALILNLPDKYNIDNLYELVDHGTKIIMGGIDDLDLKKVSLLDNNYGHGLTLAFEHLQRLGHKDIYYLNSLSGQDQYDERTHSFFECIERFSPGRTQPPQNFMISSGIAIHDSFEAGYILAKKLIESKKKFTAVICTNDMVAMSAIRAFHEAGLRVPQDVSVVGFDNIPFGAHFMPSITSVYHEKERFGKIAFDILHNSIQNNVNGFYKADVFLYKGSSSAPCKTTD